MSNTDEKMRILNMVQEGKLSAQEAVQLLEALDFNPQEKTATTESIPDFQVPANGKAHWLKIIVTDHASGKRKVNLRIPLSLVRWGMRMGGKFNIGNNSLEDFDLQRLLDDDVLNEGQKGVLVNVEDDEDGEHVLITLE